MTNKHVVIWGAGRIGRGFAADLFHEAHYHLTLVDELAELIAALRQDGRFTVVRAANADQRHDATIDGYTALTTAETDALAEAVRCADSLVIAVFPQVFPIVARQLLPGLVQRQQERPEVALDIILCTNLSHAARQFRAQLHEALPPEMHDYLAEKIGVVETLVLRMVADPPPELKQQEPLLVWTNGTAELPVDRHGFKGEIPALPSLRLVDNMQAEETRKLYTYNMCHAVLAYHGAWWGKTLAVECLHDPRIRAEAEGALAEISQALQLAYGFTKSEMALWNEKVLRQTDNPTLGDTVFRHGSDPRRKLGRTDRLVGPALLVRQQGIQPVFLARAIAAALHFHNPGDPSAVHVQQRVVELGLEAAVCELSELDKTETDLVQMIVAAYQQLALAKDAN